MSAEINTNVVMSRHAQLPPRCPLQKKTVVPQVNVRVAPLSGKDTEFHSREIGKYKITDESFILEDQPPWLNDLLNDLDLNADNTSHRQAGRTPSKILEALPDLNQLIEKETTDFGELDDELESSCMYGPNSPRIRNNLGFPGNEIASAFSGYAAQSSLQHLGGYSSMSGLQSESYRDSRASADEYSYDNKQMKRHPGQRSRARKLQYITELETTVNVLQNLGSDLAVRVASLLQKYAVLSSENSTLKQQLIRTKQKKFVVENETLSLKTQVEMLRTNLAVSSANATTTTNKFQSRSSRSTDSFNYADSIWNM